MDIDLLGYLDAEDLWIERKSEEEREAEKEALEIFYLRIASYRL